MSILNKFVLAIALALSVNAASADENRSAKLTIFAPGEDDVAGISSRGFLVDLAVEFEGTLAATNASSELTGPGLLQNTGPFPGTFSVGANKDHFPGLLVLLSSTAIAAGPGQNVSNLFNVVAVTNRTPTHTEIWATWIVGEKMLLVLKA